MHLCVHTPGCHGNGRRPHKRVDEQKTLRPSSTEMEREKERRKIKFHIFLGEGPGVYEENEEMVGGLEMGGGEGWIA